MDIEEFRAALAAKGRGTASCPTCGANAWGGLDEYVLLRVQRSEPFPDEPQIVPEREARAVAATCGQCGFLWFYDASILLGENG